MKILLVDDDPICLEMLKTVLRRKGHKVLVADNVNDAIQTFTDEELCGTPFDLIITDIVMPGKDGGELMRYVRSRGHCIPMLAITGGFGLADQDDMNYASFFATETLLKPFNEEQIFQAIQNVALSSKTFETRRELTLQDS